MAHFLHTMCRITDPERSRALPHCGGLLATSEDARGQGDVRGEYANDDEDLASKADNPRSQRGPSEEIERSNEPGGAGREPPG